MSYVQNNICDELFKVLNISYIANGLYTWSTVNIML